jgi:RNA polymerase sigma factor (sigma-70 family)
MGYHRLATPDLGRLFRGETILGLSEWQLLSLYLERRDEAAFEALVARHGPMVLGVCRRMLADRTDVEDAFQATFLVLVRRARHLGPRDAIGPWLYGVATRVAMRARSDSGRRRRFQPLTSELVTLIDDRTAAQREIGEVIDQEVNRLPPKYRHPIVLCYLEGQTHEEAARQLKWPIGTVKGRLARARDLLQSRLVRRGLTPAIGTLSFAFSPDVWAAPQRELLERTVKASLKLAFGQTSAQIVSTSITSLVEGVLTSMFLNTLKWTGAAVLVGGLAFTGMGVVARQDARAKNDEAPPAVTTVAANPGPKTLEPGAPTEIASPNAENGDDRAKLAELQRALLNAANSEWLQASQDYMSTNKGLEGAYQASKRLMTAQQESIDTPDEKHSAVDGHLERVRGLARAQQHANPSASDISAAQFKTYAAEAELWLAQSKLSSSNKEKKTGAGLVNTDGRGKDVKSQFVLAKLDEPIPMPFTEDTPLEDVLKYIKQATTTETYQGIQIYVDPVGLQEAEKSMTSTVRNMDVQGIPLRRTLQLLLKQIDLVYFVEDGVLCITSKQTEGGFGPAMYELAPILQRTGKAERGELTSAEMNELLELLKTRQEVMKLSGAIEPDPRPDDGGAVRMHATRADERPKSDAAGEKKESADAKEQREQMNLLLKEMRSLIEVLKADKQTKKTPEGE